MSLEEEEVTYALRKVRKFVKDLDVRDYLAQTCLEA